jgi:hypothetical protein
MKHFLFLLTVLTSVLFATAQKPPEEPSKLASHKLPIGKLLHTLLQTTRQNIELLDARPDSSKIGYAPARGNSYNKLTADENFTDFFQKRTSAPNTDEAYLFVLRKLWLQQTTAAEQQQSKIVMQQAEANKPYSRCYARIEVYKKRGSMYTPLFRLDSTFEHSKPLYLSAADLLLLPFEFCLQKVSVLSSAAPAANRRQMTLSEVKTFTFKKRFSPANQEAVLQRGIFHKFSDFLYNRPDTTSFTLQSDVLTDELVVNTNGGGHVLNKFWGFCDGKNIFIRLGLNVFQLHPVQNTYELWGFTTIKQSFVQSGPVGGGTRNDLISSLALHSFNSKKVSAPLKPFQLDLDTGLVY